MHTSLVLGVFFFSGLSGLVYQVIWVRLFGNVFGNTIYSATAVTAVFMFGLGVGSYVIGRWGDRAFQKDPIRPLRFYGYAELLIGFWCLLIALILPELSLLAAWGSSYTPETNGWFELSLGSHLLRYLTAAVLLAPATILMGGTLTLLIRYFVANEVDLAGWRVGLLYGFNTLGAAIGASLTDFALVPHIGIFNTEIVAIALNWLAGVIVLVTVKRIPKGRQNPTQTTIPDPVNIDSKTKIRSVSLTTIALFLSGFAALGMEMVWFRLLISILGGYRAVFSIVLTVILLGIWIGSMIGGAAHRRWGKPALIYAFSQSLFAVSTLSLAAGFETSFIVSYASTVMETYEQATTVERWILDVWANFRVALLLIGLPSICLGCTFPLANALVQQSKPSVGLRAGVLYLANTVGNVFGSLMAGFLFLPLFGIQTCFGIFVSCAIIAIAPLIVIAKHNDLLDRTGWGVFLAGPVLATFAIVIFSYLPGDHLLLRSFDFSLASRGERILATHEGINETLVVSERGNEGRRLHTNGHPMSSTLLLNQRYMRAAAHIPLLLLEQPKTMLNIAFGVGNTLHAASLHPSMERLEIADLSRAILEHSNYFASSNGKVLEDPRVHVFINDGRQHLLMQTPDKYDLISLEPPPINMAGTASLYTLEFYELARSRLREGGVMSQWLPAHQLPASATYALIKAFVAVFPRAILLGSHRNLILLGTSEGTIELDIEEIALRLEQRPAVKKDLDSVLMGTPTELAGTFVASDRTLNKLVLSVEPLVDDYPVNEYTARSNLMINVQPRELFDVSDAFRWCPKCFGENYSGGALSDLPAYLDIMQAVYWSDAFLVETARKPAPLMLSDSDSRRDAISRSPFLRMILPRLAGQR